MKRTTIEELVPGVAELRARERQNRALAFSGITRTVCGVELVSLTPRARLELQLLRNAFAVPGAEPLEGDVFTFLWVLHPARNRGAGGLQKLQDWARQALLRRRVKRLELEHATREIRIFMVEQLQDLPESSGDGRDQSAWVHWMGAEASWWIQVHGGFTFAEYLATPYLVLQQLYRGFRCNNPEMRVGANGAVIVEDPQFINGSDRLIGQFHAEHRAAAAAAIRANRTRLSR